jgi:hypothetical protein
MARYKSPLSSAFRKWGRARANELELERLMRMVGCDEETIKRCGYDRTKDRPEEFKKEMQKYLKDNS